MKHNQLISSMPLIVLKAVSILTLTFGCLTASAQTNVKSIIINKGDNLKDLLGEDYLTVDSLLISGEFDNDNFPLLINMISSGKLTGLDMSDATIENNTLLEKTFDAKDDYLQLKYIKLPNSLEEIGEWNFIHTNIIELTLPESLKKIGKFSFKDCNALERLHLPDNLTLVDAMVFANTPKLKEVTFGNQFLYTNGTCFTNSLIEKLIFNEPFEVVGPGSFKKSSELTTVFLPSTVTKVYAGAFSNSPKLRYIYCQSVVPPVFTYGKFELIDGSKLDDKFYDEPAFENIHPDAVLYVPVGTKAIYENAECWKDFKTIIETADFTTDIANVYTTDRNTPIYDLQGRQVKSVSHRGIYIQNGRKILK